MTTKHTPGPWRVNWNPPHRAEIETVDQTPGKYRHMTNDCPMLAGPDDEIEIVKDERTGRECKLSAESCANMRLMAAAPEMLEALNSVFRMLLGPEPKTLKGWAQRCSFIDRTVRNALNKAEGINL
jgi:hypothetical protein